MKTTTPYRGNPLRDMLEWLKELTENLVDESVPDNTDASATSSRESASETRGAVILDVMRKIKQIKIYDNQKINWQIWFRKYFLEWYWLMTTSAMEDVLMIFSKSHLIENFSRSFQYWILFIFIFLIFFVCVTYKVVDPGESHPFQYLSQ